MTKIEWVQGFKTALLKLRPHLSSDFAWKVAHVEWPGNQTVDPEKAAAAWAGRQPAAEGTQSAGRRRPPPR